MIEPAVNAMQEVYRTLGRDNLHQLEPLYAPNVVFTDPAGTVAGRDELLAHFARLYENIETCTFEFHPEQRLLTEDQAALGWRMRYSHRRFNGGKAIDVEGCSLLGFEGGMICRHRDWFDLGAMVYEHLPLVGGLVRNVKRRLEA